VYDPRGRATTIRDSADKGGKFLGCVDTWDLTEARVEIKKRHSL
jgi:hypothetical protein